MLTYVDITGTQNLDYFIFDICVDMKASYQAVRKMFEWRVNDNTREKVARNRFSSKLFKLYPDRWLR